MSRGTAPAVNCRIPSSRSDSASTIAVVVPAYNPEPYLLETIASIGYTPTPFTEQENFRATERERHLAGREGQPQTAEEQMQVLAANAAIQQELLSLKEELVS